MSLDLDSLEAIEKEDSQSPEAVEIWAEAGVAEEGAGPTSKPNRPGGRRRRKKLPWFRIALAAAAALVILFAFVWEASLGNRREQAETQARRNYPPPERSGVQDELNSLDWVYQDFLPINEFSRPGTLLDEINGIVIHFIGNPNTTARQNRNYFANLATTRLTHASSNFIVCLDGAIIQCVPVDEIAYASNARNADTLSIELCHPDETGRFTDETYASAVRLTAWLCVQYGLTSDDVIRHYDVIGKICPKYFVENEDAWDGFKADVDEAIEGLGARD
jgi:hypothetical protein